MLLPFCLAGVALAQLPPLEQPDMVVDGRKAAQAALDSIGPFLTESYVFPEKVPALIEALATGVDARDYAKEKSAIAVAEKFTARIRALAHDRHMELVYSHERIPTEQAPERPEEIAARENADAEANWGFAGVQVMDGNVGYLDLRFFAEPRPPASDKADAAMALLGNTRALIIDLRQNHGGDPGMVARLASPLFDAKTHLNDIFWRPNNSTEAYWTAPVKGPAFHGPVWVLTSSKTYSAAEELAYDLQSLKRATVVGETTRGGAHPVTLHRIDDHFLMLIPSGRSINPVTHTDWEGTGVHPDVSVPADRALRTALEAARKK